MSSEENELRSIARKLDTIIALLKISNYDKLDTFRENLSKDKIYFQIIRLSDGTKKYSDITKQISEDLNVAEITVKKKISELTKHGVIVPEKSGKESYYNTTGLFD